MVDYSLDTPKMRLVEEVKKKYGTDMGKALVSTYLFLVSKSYVFDENVFWHWCDMVCDNKNMDAAFEYAKIISKKDFLHGGLDKPIYKHCNGAFYLLLGEAYDSETLEEKVVYQALYGKNEVWVRPKDMFFGQVEFNGKCVPRFQKATKDDLDKWGEEDG